METIGIGATHVGQKREGNEDAFFVDNDAGIYLVADGMGGHAAGEVASQMTVDTVREVVAAHADVMARIRDNPAEQAALTAIAERALSEACARIHREASARRDRAGMGCTATMLLVAGPRAAMGHVGDSRMYLRRAGSVHQLSVDHTLAQELFARGAITAEEAKNHQYAHVLSRAIGTQPAVRVDTLPLHLLPGDRFMLCSDGLADYIPSNAWVGDNLADGDPEDAADRLVAFANDAGGKDNITVVVAEVAGDEESDQDRWAARVSTRMAALGKVPLFDKLKLSQQSQLMNICTDVRCAAGDELAREGEPLEGMYMVVRGALEVSRGGTVIDTVGPGSSIGATALIGPRRARATVRATENTNLLSLSHDDFRALVRRRPWVGVRLLEQLATRLSRELEWAMALVPPEPGGPAQLV